MSNSLTIAARIVSVFLHPLFVPLYAFLITLSITGHYRLQIPEHAQLIIAVAVFALTAVVPSLIFYIMLRMRMISSLQMPFRQERNVPILITALSFYLTYQLLSKFGVAPLFGFYMLAASMLSLVALGINLWMKISLHMVALGALAGSMAVFAKLFGEQYLFVALMTILAAGLTGAARLTLNAHRQREIYLGFLTGFAWMYVLFALIR
ncbi:MAG: hypothetical protein LWX09_12190 [Bacteroidia bacterium]|jgi:hypothetical protein|nr:hypothetical protein [Bacteroidia bacterium]